MSNNIKEINDIIIECINKYIKKDSDIKAGMVYNLVDNGKRLRPSIIKLILETKNIDYKKYKEVICAIEMIHTYSLVHDDLPALDNDTLRRNKPTTHIKFGEANAILIGDALLNDAFFILSSSDIDPSLLIKIINTLSYFSGSNGMIYGQVLDIKNENNKDITLELLDEINLHKTANLIQAAFIIAALIIEEEVHEYMDLGYYLGLAFQIQDDILDFTKTSSELGKDSQSDLKNDKKTYIDLVGIDKAIEIVEDYFNKIDNLITKLGLENTYIREYINSIKQRQY